MKKSLIATLLALLCITAGAQTEVEYRWEIGGGLGTMTYTGDFNSGIFKSGNTAFEAQLILRRTFNPYSHLRFALTYGKITGESRNEKTFYPDYNTGAYNESARVDYKFSNPLFDLGAIYEYNFWPYGTGREYRGAKRLTPFIGIGLGFTYVSTSNGYYDGSLVHGTNDGLFGAPTTSGSGAFTVNMPIGLGVKYKVGQRTNMQLEWIAHLSMSDKLDGAKDPYRISSDGIFKNTDCYSVLQLSLTYSFGPKCSTCMNSDWNY